MKKTVTNQNMQNIKIYANLTGGYGKASAGSSIVDCAAVAKYDPLKLQHFDVWSRCLCVCVCAHVSMCV